MRVQLFNWVLVKENLFFVTYNTLHLKTTLVQEPFHLAPSRSFCCEINSSIIANPLVPRHQFSKSVPTRMRDHFVQETIATMREL